MPQDELHALLAGIGDGKIGMDSSIMPTRHGVTLVQTTDFFYPLVEDPYKQGKIACANVLSDLYAMGISHCDNMLMLVAASRDMTPEDRTIVTRLMIEGFHDHARSAGTHVTGGQTVLNPWPIIGGVATGVVLDSEVIVPTQIAAGHVMVLTKALGTQVAVNLKQWVRSDKARWAKASEVISEDQVNQAFLKAEASMIRLNRTGAELMHTHGSAGATDVTGFGLLGHAGNLAGNQVAPVVIRVHTLPIIAGMDVADSHMGNMFKLLAGRSAETSGGLFAALPTRQKALDFIRDIKERDGMDAWIVADVVERDQAIHPKNTAIIVDTPTIIHV